MNSDFIKDTFENQIRWIAHANSTASIILGLAGASFFWMLTHMADTSLDSCIVAVSIGLFVLTNGGSIVCLLAAVWPRTKGSGLSLSYFGDIVRRSKEEYIKLVEEVNAAQSDNLLAEQIYINAQIAQRKFDWIKRGIVLLVLSTIPVFVLILVV